MSAMKKRDPLMMKAFERRGAVKAAAKACGISTQAVSQWREIPEARLQDVARALGVAPSALRNAQKEGGR